MEDQQDQQIQDQQEQLEVPDNTEVEPETTTQVEPETTTQEEPAPTKSVKTFWNRLDEVLALVKQGREENTSLESILEQFEDSVQLNQTEYRSFIFQPERVSLSSNDDIKAFTARQDRALNLAGHAWAERFSTFRINFKKALRNVKSIQLLSAVIPNAIQNIPDNQVCFFWYKVRPISIANFGAYNNAFSYTPGDIVTFLGNTFVCRQPTVGAQPTGVFLGPIWIQITLPADATRPNYYDLNPYRMYVVYLFPTFGLPQESLLAANERSFNKTFVDYDDLVTSLNYCMTQVGLLGNTNAISNDITFAYDAITNKIQMIPRPSQVALGFYYMPAGYDDPNIQLFMNLPDTQTFFGVNLPGCYEPQITLNYRLGFTWNGVFPNPFTTPNVWGVDFTNSIYWYLRPKDPAYIVPWAQNLLTANSYGDLVNTSCVRLYTDITLGSTEDSGGQAGLLSIIPVNTTNLGVGFYQNNFSNPLTKIVRNITEIGITMLNDQGQPYYLPNSATVLLELALTYY